MQAGLYKIVSEFIDALTASGETTVLGLDLGGRKVGVAKGNMILKIAVPLVVIEYKNQADLAQKLKIIIKENHVGGLVIGLPSEELETKFAGFVNGMNLGLPFIFEDETYTTKIANNMLIDLGIKRKKRNQIDDKISAQIILDAFLSRNTSQVVLN